MSFVVQSNIDAAWPTDSYMEATRDILIKDLKAKQVSTPWKAFLDISKRVSKINFDIDQHPDFFLDPVNTKDKLLQYAEVSSTVFGHGNISTVKLI